MKNSVLITGGTSGIGAALAKEFAAQGHNLVLVARNAERLKTVASELSMRYRVDTKVIACDLANPDSAESIFLQLRKENIPIDVLINNAGFNVYGAFVGTDLAKELQLIQLMVASVTSLTKFFVKDMIRRGSGRILNICSTGSFAPGPLDAVYQASKAYMLSFSEALSEELHGTNVIVTALCPGATTTEFADRAGMTGVRLFKWLTMSPESVARIGIKATTKGRRTVVTGVFNKLLVLSIRFSPKGMLLKTGRYLLSGS